MRKLVTLGLITSFLIAISTSADASTWVEKSNEHAQVVLDVLAKLSPEGAGQLGVDGLDEEIADLGPGIEERSKKMSEDVLAELRRRLTNEADSKVR